MYLLQKLLNEVKEGKEIMILCLPAMSSCALSELSLFFTSSCALSELSLFFYVILRPESCNLGSQDKFHEGLQDLSR